MALQLGMNILTKSFLWLSLTNGRSDIELDGCTDEAVVSPAFCSAHGTSELHVTAVRATHYDVGASA